MCIFNIRVLFIASLLLSHPAQFPEQLFLPAQSTGAAEATWTLHDTPPPGNTEPSSGRPRAHQQGICLFNTLPNTNSNALPMNSYHAIQCKDEDDVIFGLVLESAYFSDIQWSIWRGGANHQRHRWRGKKHSCDNSFGSGASQQANTHGIRMHSGAEVDGARVWPAGLTPRPAAQINPHSWPYRARLCSRVFAITLMSNTSGCAQMPHRKPARARSLGPGTRPEEHLKTLPRGLDPLPELQQRRGRPTHRAWSRTKELREMAEVLTSLIVVVMSLQIHGSKYHNVTVYADYISVKLTGWGGGGQNVL